MNLIQVELFRQTTNHTCGPAALKTFLNHYLLDKEEQTEEHLAKILNTCPLEGTKFDVISTYMWSQGIDITIERSDSNINVKEIIDSGRIILTEWIDWGGHFVIICGYDNTHYCLVDPFSNAKGGKVWVEQDRFHSMWFIKNEQHANLLYLT